MTTTPRRRARVSKVAVVYGELGSTYLCQQDGSPTSVHLLSVVHSISEVELRVLRDIHCEPSSSPFQILSCLKRKNTAIHDLKNFYPG